MKKKLAFVFLLAIWHVLPAQEWVPVLVDQPPANFDFQNISMVDANVVWALADSIYSSASVPVNQVPAVLRSVDGGSNWDYFRVSEAKGRFAWMIQGIDANTAIFTTNQFNAADTRPIFKTTDGGLSWKEITPPNNSGGLLIHFFDAQNGLVINRQRVSTTIDGGETWTLVPVANSPVFASDEFNLLNFSGNYSARVGDRIWVGTSKGRIYRTLDRGHHWDMTQVAGVSDNVLSIAFSDSLHGVASAPYSGAVLFENSKLYATSDGGTTWSPIAPAPMGVVSTIGAVPEAEGHYFVGSFFFDEEKASHIALNTNHLSEDAWQTPMPDSVYLNCLQFRSPTQGFAAAWSSRVADEVVISGQSWNKNYLWKWTGSVVSNTNTPETGHVLDCFPNPVSDVVNIRLPMADTEGCQLSLTDLQGRRVHQLNLGGQTNDLVQLDLKQIPAGLYLLVLSGPNGLITQKISKL